MGVAAPHLIIQSRLINKTGTLALAFDSASNNTINSPSFFNDIQDDINIKKSENYSDFEKYDVLEDNLPLKEYNGFCLSELAEITVSFHKIYHDITGIFIRSFRTLFLENYAHNEYYPEPYLVVCPDLELEGIGSTKDDSFLDICRLFNIYYTEATKISTDIQDFMDLIETNINTMNSWKQEFYRLFWNTRKSANFPLSHYKHSVSIKE